MLKKWKKYWLEICLTIPMLIYILGFTVWPVIQSIIMSFQDRYTNELSLSTYQYLFNRPDFTESIWNTTVISIFSLALQIVLGMLVALLLTKKFKGRGLLRSFVLMPMGIPTLVSGVMAMYIFSLSGYLNELIFRLGLSKMNWLGGGGFRGIVIIALADTWKVLPTVVLFLMAGLEAIPRELYEASAIDGASKWQNFRHITFPLVKSAITMSVLFRAVNVFRIFELPQIMVGKSIPFVATYAYEEYNLGNYNASGAASTVLLVMILIFTFLYLKFIDKGEGFGNE